MTILDNTGVLYYLNRHHKVASNIPFVIGSEHVVWNAVSL